MKTFIHFKFFPDKRNIEYYVFKDSWLKHVWRLRIHWLINKAKNIIKSLIDEGEWSPNLKSHFLNNLLTVETSQVLELQNYLKTVRKEAISRIIYLLYDSETKTMDLKYWLGYAKKKFLGYEFPIAKSIK